MQIQPKTAQGRCTLEKIVAAAASLIHNNGVHGTSVDKIIAASKAGKSQFYHYFKSKDSVIDAVIEHHNDNYLTPMLASLETVNTVDEFEQWSDTVISTSPFLNNTPILGCPMAMLADELAPTSTHSQVLLSEKLEEMKQAYLVVLQRIQSNGEIKVDADLNALADGMSCILQGGLLLSKTHQSIMPMKNAASQWISYLRLLK